MAAAVFVAVAGVAFAAGRLTAPAASAANRNGGSGAFAGAFGSAFGAAGGNGVGGGNGAGGGGFRGFGGLAGGLTVEGTVTALGDGSLTLQVANGQNITVETSSGTTYHAQATASASQVTVGTKVIVRTTFARPGGGGGLAGGTQPLPGASGGTGAVGGAGSVGAPNGGLGNRTFTASDVTIAQ